MSDEVLGSTVENFASRIRRKLKEQEEQQSISSRAAAERQAAMLRAMTAVRKALTEASKISLGNRFSLSLDVSDWEGWPRLELRLVDAMAPDLASQALIASTNDRNELGTVQLQLRSGEIIGRVHLRDAEEFNKLPLLLKKCMRQFLDLVAHSVLNPQRPEESLEYQTKAIQEDEPAEPQTDLSSENLFTEDQPYNGGDNRAQIVEDEPAMLIPLQSGPKLQPC